MHFLIDEKEHCAPNSLNKVPNVATFQSLKQPRGNFATVLYVKIF